jgi:hypothetical protein
MKTAPKVFIGLIVLILLLIGGAVFYVYHSLDDLVEAAIEKYGSQTTQTAVRVDKVRIQLTDGAGAISGISVANPTGFTDPHAFTLGKISTRIDISSLTETPIIIDEVHIKAPAIFYEINKAGKANLNVLKDNVMQSVPAKPAGKKPAPAEPGKKEEPKLVIRRFIVDDGSIKATVAQLEGKVLQTKLPRMELRNVGGKGGATPQELAKQISDQMIKQAQDAVAKLDVEKYLKEEAKKRVNQEVDKRLDQELDKQLGPGNEDAKDAIKNLLGR